MTDSNSLDLTRFQQLLDVHGPELARWPEPLQGAARQLLAASPAARAAREQAQQFAALLDAAPEILPSAELLARVATLPARQPRGWAGWWPFGNPVAPLMGWAAAAAFGLVVGSGSIPLLDSSAELDVAASEVDVEGSEVLGPQLGASDSTSQPGRADGDAASEEDWNELELALGLGLDWEEEP